MIILLSFTLFLSSQLQQNLNKIYKIPLENLNSQEISDHYDVIARDQKIRMVKFEMKSNENMWIVFGKNPIDPSSNHHPSYTIRNPIGELPDMRALKRLQYLDISFLGLKALPQGLDKLENLQTLKISFNNIDISRAMNTISQLSGLKELYIFGTTFSDEDILFLKKKNPDLNVYYTREQFIQLMKDRGE